MSCLRVHSIAILLFLMPVSPSWSGLLPQVEIRAVANAQHEIEPALYSYTHFGVEYSTMVHMEFDPDFTNVRSKLRYFSWTSQNQTTTGLIPLHAEYDRYADPVLAKSPTSTQIYLVGLGTNSAGGTGILVWYTNNGGWSWSSPYRIASGSSGNVLDKPAVTVAPNGTVWVTYTRSSLQRVTAQFGTLSASTWSWSPQIDVRTSTTGTASQVMADANNDIYVLFRNNTAINLWREDAAASGVTFVQLPNVPNVGTFFYGGVNPDTITLAGDVRVRATTVPVAKLDRTNRRISVAWHEQNGGLGQSRIRFASLRTNVLPYTWTANPPTISTASGYNINVGMDFDTSGGYVVTWYRFAPGQSSYTNIGTYVRFDAAGNPAGESPSNVTGRTGDVRHYRPDSVPCNAETPPACCVDAVDICSVGRRYIGEYHDVSFTNGRFKCAHLIIGLPDTGETIGDPWVFIVSHVIP